jgi:uncharacterized protein YukE
MSDQFTVTTATLREVATQLGERAEEADQIAGKAKQADVDTKSWGLLGLGLGLYANYTSARDTANASIAKISSFLTDAQSALQNTARDYDQADQAGGALFESIHQELP